MGHCAASDMIGCVLTIIAHMGGSIPDHQALVRWADRSGCEVRIEGDCASACTMLLEVGCVAPGARLGFHRAKGDDPAFWTARMAAALPEPMRAWYLAGPANSRRVVWITAAEAIKMGAKSCR